MCAEAVHFKNFLGLKAAVEDRWDGAIYDSGQAAFYQGCGKDYHICVRTGTRRKTTERRVGNSKAEQKAGVPKHITIHSLRHSFKT